MNYGLGYVQHQTGINTEPLVHPLGEVKIGFSFDSQYFRQPRFRHAQGLGQFALFEGLFHHFQFQQLRQRPGLFHLDRYRRDTVFPGFNSFSKCQESSFPSSFPSKPVAINASSSKKASRHWARFANQNALLITPRSGQVPALPKNALILGASDFSPVKAVLFIIHSYLFILLTWLLILI